MTIIALYLLIFPLARSANEGEPTSFDPINNDIKDLIPPLSVLIDSAISNSPMVNFWDLQVEIDKNNIKTVQRDWTDHLGISSEARTGRMDNLILNQDQAGLSTQELSSSDQTRYFIGMFVRLPLGAVWKRSKQINIARLELEQARNNRLSQQREIKREIIKSYNNLLLAQKLLKIRANSQEFAALHWEMAEIEFSNGKMELDELTRIQDNYTRSLDLYETAKTNFLIEYMLLEELTGIDFQMLNISRP